MTLLPKTLMITTYNQQNFKINSFLLIKSFEECRLNDCLKKEHDKISELGDMLSPQLTYFRRDTMAEDFLKFKM